MSLQKIACSVRRLVTLAVVLVTVFSTLGVPKAQAQDSLERRVKSKVSPTYPEIARKMNLAGVVKLEVTVAPNGNVKETKVIGGNPILVNAAIDAVKKWRFETASDESVGVVEFKFDPSVN